MNPRPRPWHRFAAWWRHEFLAPLDQVEEQARQYLCSAEGRRLDRKTMIVLTTTAVALTIMEYGKSPDIFVRPLHLLASLGFTESAAAGMRWLDSWERTAIRSLTWWAMDALLAYCVIPMLVIRFWLRESLADYGLGVGSALKGWRLYLVMIAVMVPLVNLASADRSFQAKYPFYPLRPGESVPPDFFRWEVLYALQFVALEFFFRGFVLHGVKHRFGTGSIFVMMVPYCMIHFGKPMPETFAAIIAGIVLGAMSLKTRSIWLGAALHISVAWSMDAMALWRKGIIG